MFDASGQMVPAPFFDRRVKQLPVQGVVIGVQAPKLPVPFSPALPHLQQYAYPTLPVRVMLASVARKIALAPHTETPGLTFKAVKIYRVVHVIPPFQPFVHLGIEARDPEFYRPFYLGEYNKDGRLMDEDDPFLYWMLPVLRDDINDPQSAIRNYAMRHAGDPAWIRPAGQQGWVWVQPGN